MTQKAQLRQSEILRILEEKGTITTDELSKLLCCSKPTIRKDLCELEEKGLLARILNGAKYADPEQPYSIFARSSKHITEKKKIAEYVLKNIVKPYSTIMLDSGTTAFEIAEEIQRQDFPVTVFTNSMYILSVLSRTSSVRLFSFSGFYNPERGCFEDDFLGHFVNQYHADLCFLGINGISCINGKPTISIIAAKECPTKLLFHEMSTKTIIVCDHSKIMKGEPIIVPFNMDKLQVITDSKANDEDIKLLRKSGLDIVKVED